MANSQPSEIVEASTMTSAIPAPDGTDRATPVPVVSPATATYRTVGTQTEASMLDLFHTFSKRKWALSLAEQYMNIHPSFREGDIILKSSDDVGFKFSLAELGAHSTFFKDLADLPRPEDSSNVIPFPNASAATLEVLLVTLTKRPTVHVPSVFVLDELVDLVDAFDFDMSRFHYAVFDSDLNLGYKHAFAYTYAPSRKDDIAMDILSEGRLRGTYAWSRCPGAHCELEELFHKWSLVRGRFKEMFTSTAVNGNDDFSKRCIRQECRAFDRSRYQWDNLKRAAANAISRNFPSSPRGGSGAVEETCANAVPCDVCAKRLSQHARCVWSQLVWTGRWKE